MIVKADNETKAPDPGGKDYSIGAEMDDDQDWIREELAERLRQIESGEAKFITLEEFKEFISSLRREKGRRP